MKFKGFIRRAKKSFSLVLIVLMASTMLTGCTIDNSKINAALINSVLMKDISRNVQEQAALIIDLRDRSLIPATMANSLLTDLESIAKGVATVNQGNISLTGEEDPDAVPTIDASSKDRHEFIDRVIMSIAGFYAPGSPATELSDIDTAETYVEDYGSIISAHQGYDTEVLLKNSGYKSSYNDGDHDKAKKNALDPFGGRGDTVPASITGLVNHLNNLHDLDVYYLQPEHASNTEKLAKIKANLVAAQGGDTAALAELQQAFKIASDKINLSTQPLTVESVYKAELVPVSDYGKQGEVKGAVKYYIKLLDGTEIEKAYKIGSKELDLSSGVLVGNKFFVTRYPLAVFRGLEQDPSDESKYLPVFFPTDAAGTTTSIKGSGFSGSAPSLTEEFSTSAGGKGTAETKTAYVDIYTGSMYYKGGQVNAANDYMGIGSTELEASFVVKPASKVYKVSGNESLITTTSHTGSSAYTPVDKVDIGVTTIEISKAKDFSEMPVFFLTDYLELIYSPDTVGYDAFTAYGRKVKLDEKIVLGKDAITADTGSIAYIVGDGATTDGWKNRTANYPSIGVEDLMDIDGFYTYSSGFQAKTKEEGTSAENGTSVVRLIKSGLQFEAAGTIHSGDVTAERSDMLPQIAAQKSVECVMRFGASGLDEGDEGVRKKTPLYGILVRGNVYERQLLTDWILASGNANLIKWEKTIAELGYPNYKISNAVLDEKLKGNYAFELNQDGLLTLDLDTILEINKEYEEERRGGALVYLRTLLLVLGFVLIAYVSVLIGAWVADVNFDLGLNLLHKVSIGHFVAVRSLDEMPEAGPESKTTYVDFRKLLVRCFVFAAVGVIILTVDPVNLVIKIMTWLSFVINFLSEKLFGVKVF